MPKEFLKGNEAFAHAALEAGVRVCAGYPGTPSSEVIETIAAEHAAGRAKGVHVEWSTNEKAALELLAGAAYSGARTLYTCKQVGLNVASDPLMSLNYVGVKGGTVLYVADDPGPISSQTEQDTRRFASFAKVPVFDPATPEQGCAMMAAAYDLSERYATPVIMRPTTRICHASAYIDVAAETEARQPEGFERDPKWVIFPKRSYKGHGEINERLPQIAGDFSSEAYDRFNPQLQVGEGPRFGIVAGGISYAYAREALRLLEAQAAEGKLVWAEGAPAAPVLPPQCEGGYCTMGGPAWGKPVEALPAYRIMQVGTPYPFPATRASRFADGLSDVICFEELDHVLEDEMLKLAGATRAGYAVHGKLTGETTDRGENTVDAIAAQLRAFFGVELAEPEQVLCAPGTSADGEGVDGGEAAQAPARPPMLCPGCPHRGAFYAVKTALRKPSDGIFCGDIGCYTLGNAKPLDAVDTCLCMGAGITVAQGFSVAEPGKKALSFVGDSTFFASGMTGIANAVYNQHDITVCVLDNATTAMTGSQPHPGTGVTLMGPKTKPISIEAVLRALGVTVITHANPLHLDEARAAAREAIEFDGPSAVIFESPCVKLIKPGAPVRFDEGACTGCGKCVLKIGCPALSWSKEERRPVVDVSLCNGCGLCTYLCESSALSCEGNEGSAR